MATDLLEIKQDEPSEKAIARAADVVRKGGVVAIPTDALYCLVADPLNLNAVARVFAAKGRETQRALPVWPRLAAPGRGGGYPPRDSVEQLFRHPATHNIWYSGAGAGFYCPSTGQSKIATSSLQGTLVYYEVHAR